ncbi:MAG: hypothetical protein Q9157_004985 [Trypethelium eluteriae]
MEQGSFIRWGEIWELDSADKARKSKLQSYLNEETKIGPHVVHTLGKMSAVFADTAKLAEKYGVQAKYTKKMEQFKTTDVIDGKELISIGQKLDSEEVEKKFKKKCEKQRERLGVMKSMKFAIKDKEKFQKMIAQLREFNWWLIRNCSAEDARNLEWSIIDIVFAIDDPAILRRFCKVAAAGAWQAGKINSNQRCRVVYEKLQDIADFKANMSEAKPAPTYSYDDFSIEPRYSFKEGRATLAKFYKLSEPRIVLIEWRDASTTDRNELTKLAAIMYGKRPIDVRVPYSYGLVMPSSRSQGRYGLILEPPAHIREFEEPKLEEGLVRYRMPITLSRMLLRTDGSKDIMELGTRFRLAKALVESVHKNIRSESIIFFPPLSSTGSGPPKELPRQYDFDRPLLTGMDRARTDEPAERPDYNYDDEDYRANDIVLDIYQHPDKRENRLRRYQRAYVSTIRLNNSEIGYSERQHILKELQEQYIVMQCKSA